MKSSLRAAGVTGWLFLILWVWVPIRFDHIIIVMGRKTTVATLSHQNEVNVFEIRETATATATATAGNKLQS